MREGGDALEGGGKAADDDKERAVEGQGNDAAARNGSRDSRKSIREMPGDV